MALSNMNVLICDNNIYPDPQNIQFHIETHGFLIHSMVEQCPKILEQSQMKNIRQQHQILLQPKNYT